MEEFKEELNKYCELSAYDGGHDFFDGLTKKGRVKRFKYHFIKKGKHLKTINKE
jgi:hypothetical protein